MEISLLREFIVLSQTLNYTKAAEMLHVTQPTLSKHIVSMEKELGCSLLERDRRRVELTEAGNVFAAAALQIVDTYTDAKERIHEIQSQTPIRANGIIGDNAIASIISIAATFLDAEGQAPVLYQAIDEMGSLENLAEGDVDLLLTYADVDKLDEMGFAYAPLVRSPFVAMMSLDNPLSARSSVSMDDLRNSRFIKFADSYSISGWTNIERVCKDHGYTPATRTIVGRNQMNYCAVPLTGEDIMILQSSMPQLRFLSDFAQVAVVPVVDDDAVFKLYSIYRKDNIERVKPVLDAYARARKIILNHGKENALVESA